MAFSNLRLLRGLGRATSGNVMLEFALALPVLCVMLVGMLDLARYGMQRSAMSEGARAGAEYGVFIVSTGGMTSLGTSDQAAIGTTAQNASGLSGVTVTASLFCECTAGTSVSCTSTCGSGTLKKYVKVTATRSFTSVLTRASLSFGSRGQWTPPTSISATMTMISP
ncbi:MAG TPA: TadE/TadG family type IV pilus assembly protein [Reyranella sp.]|nr:TadE/TadG family type IV pilus assembly protein [Reyranella sp.]